MRLGALVLVLLGATLRAQDAPLPSRPTDPWQLRAHQLEQQLAESRAEVLKRRIEVSTCKATIDSVVFSDEAKALVDEFVRVFGGTWIWSSEENRPVRPKEKSE